MAARALKPIAQKHKRRWLQFSLRSLMIFTMICAAVSGYLAKKIEQKRHEQAAVDAIVKLGGLVSYDYDQGGGAREPTPAWLTELLGENFFSDVEDVDFGAGHVPQSNFASADTIDFEYLIRLETLDLSRANLSDAGMAHLEGLSQLRQLNLRWNHATDVGVARISGLTRLEELDLTWNRITDRGLVELSGLSRLRKLNLSDNPINDPGLEHLGGLPKLEELGLEGTNVTDAGLTSLTGLSRLSTVNLSRTTVTNSGVVELQKALPNCTIVH